MPTLLHRRTILKEIESRVRKWLDTAGVAYIPGVQLSIPGSAKIDFLLLKPFPVAIDITWSDPSLWARMAKNLLAMRINLASQYGVHLPVVAIVSRAYNGQESSSFSEKDIPPFFDAVFDVEQLPDIENWPNLLKLNPLTQDILKRGEPRDVTFTDPDEIPILWSKSLTVSELIRPEPFPENSLAERSRQMAVGCLKAEKAKQTATLKNHKPILLSSNDESRLINLPQFHKEFEKILKDEIIARLGGKIEDLRLPLQLDSLSQNIHISIRAMVWNAPDGRHIALRKQILSDSPLFSYQAKSLISEAWMLRSLSSNPFDELLLLVGTKTEKTPNAYWINVLESAGWSVLPWDFAEKKPLFINRLRYGREISD